MKTIAYSKVDLRRIFKERLASMATQQAALHSISIKNIILSLPEFLAAKTVMTYLSFSGEVDTFGIAQAVLDQGKKLIVPKVKKSPKSLAACHINDFDGLVSNQYGIMEPDASHAHPISPEEIDFQVIPGMAFSRTGARLGRGGGYYDRFLEDVSPDSFLAGVCFDFQIMDDLPTDPWDKPVHAVITEKEIFRFR